MIETITFGKDETPLDEYCNIPWDSNSSKVVEFYENKPVTVIVTDTENPKLEEILNSLVDGDKIAVDLEWKPDVQGESNPISLFQFCSSKFVVIVENSFSGKCEVLEKFLTENEFYGKGMSCDKKKLKNQKD